MRPIRPTRPHERRRWHSVHCIRTGDSVLSVVEVIVIYKLALTIRCKSMKICRRSCGSCAAGKQGSSEFSYEYRLFQFVREGEEFLVCDEPSFRYPSRSESDESLPYFRAARFLVPGTEDEDWRPVDADEY